MKKIIAFIIFALLLVSAISCSAGKNESNIEADNENQKIENNDADEITTSPESDENTYIGWLIGNRRVEYYPAEKQFILRFSLSHDNASENYISASGTAHVIITDKSEYVIYDRILQFDESDFRGWNNQSWDGSRYMCGLTIPISDIEGSSSSTGVLSLDVSLEDGSTFPNFNMEINNLPSLSVNINLPSVPYDTVDKYNSSAIFTISNITYESTMSYDGTANVEFTVTSTLTSNGESGDEYANITYKLLNSSGVVVDSGTFYGNEVSVGETSIDTFSIYNLQPRDTYTLKLINE